MFKRWERVGRCRQINLERVPDQGMGSSGPVLSHGAVGGFSAHCGWNSSLEGISAGLPMVTWPLFDEQFSNEKVIVQFLRVGSAVGSTSVKHLGEEEDLGVTITRGDVGITVEEVRDKEKSVETKERAKKLGEMVRKALGTGGSSYNDLTIFIQDMARTSKNQV